MDRGALQEAVVENAHAFAPPTSSHLGPAAAPGSRRVMCCKKDIVVQALGGQQAERLADLLVVAAATERAATSCVWDGDQLGWCRMKGPAARP